MSKVFPRITRLMAEQTDILAESDFSPLPCSHPQCVSLSYLLKLKDGSYVPFSRFIDFHKYNTMLRSSATLPASPEIHKSMHDVIHDVFANEDELDVVVFEDLAVYYAYRGDVENALFWSARAYAGSPAGLRTRTRPPWAWIAAPDIGPNCWNCSASSTRM